MIFFIEILLNMLVLNKTNECHFIKHTKDYSRLLKLKWRGKLMCI